MYNTPEKNVVNEICHSKPKENVIILLLVVTCGRRSQLVQVKERLPLVAFPQKPYSPAFYGAMLIRTNTTMNVGSRVLNNSFDYIQFQNSTDTSLQ